MAGLNVMELDLYQLLGIEQSCTTKEIKTAYRKKALTCHPDKNPDDLQAAERFHTLSKALEILIDLSARAAYDKVLNAKRAAKLRHRHLDARRKKFKEDLEAKEQASMKVPTSIVTEQVYAKSDEETLKAEIERLRKQGSRELKEEIEIVRKQVEEEWRTQRKNLQGSFTRCGSQNHNLSGHRLRFRWDIKDGEYLYNEEMLRNIFEKYGAVSGIVISSKRVKPGRKGSGIVEFENAESAEAALCSEKGLKGNPLIVESLQPMANLGTSESTSHDDDDSNQEKAMNEDKTPSKRSFPLFASTSIHAKTSPVRGSSSTSVGSTDFENLVLRRLRQAQERKRLEEEMKAEDEESL